MTQSDFHLLLVDDDAEFLGTMTKWFQRLGFQVQGAEDGKTALELAARQSFDVAIFDMMMPGMSGLDLLKEFRQQHSECEVCLLTGEGTIESAVAAMKLGAFDYVTKPAPLKELEQLIGKALERHKLRKENTQLKEILARTQPPSEMVGDSAVMQEIYRLIERAGPSDKSILIQGESGTGKELVARALHRYSRRADRPMVTINCAALPEPLLESELFGHEKGAFTGAVSAKSGLFEVADGSTLFIDEIGELPGALQAKLLRVLEDGSLRRVGSVKERRVDVRLLAATNRNLVDEVSCGAFREDLFYRINVMSLQLPPLRERQGDVTLLVEKFLGTEWEIEAKALEVLERYDWPGNVRQLMNVIDRGQIMADENIVREGDLPSELKEFAVEDSLSRLTSDDLSVLERAKIIEVLRRESGNKSRAARLLGIERRKLYRLIDKFAISPTELR